LCRTVVLGSLFDNIDWVPEIPQIDKTALAKHMGERLRALRRERELTQREFATRVGLSKEYYGRIERGRVLPSVETLYALACELDVCVSDILGEISQFLVDPSGKDPLALQRLAVQLRRAPPETLKVIAALLKAVSRLRR
jgi:transcriptional regulator with XRE-family HTH domain